KELARYISDGVNVSCAGLQILVDENAAFRKRAFRLGLYARGIKSKSVKVGFATCAAKDDVDFDGFYSLRSFHGDNSSLRRMFDLCHLRSNVESNALTRQALTQFGGDFSVARGENLGRD